MKKSLFIGTLLITLFSNSSHAQSNSRKYIRLIVLDANTREASLEIDTYLRSQDGILTSRMDRNTGVYLGVYLEDSEIDAHQIIDWIEGLGYTSKCFVEGAHGTGETIKRIDIESCNGSSISIDN
ncbi:MAG: hypothetical protein HRT57_15175 [Crocinitomicaceae bacterium]|nr:hypothetical protein [Crocinitomicaceae bacterium]